MSQTSWEVFHCSFHEKPSGGPVRGRMAGRTGSTDSAASSQGRALCSLGCQTSAPGPRVKLAYFDPDENCQPCTTHLPFSDYSDSLNKSSQAGKLTEPPDPRETVCSGALGCQAHLIPVTQRVGLSSHLSLERMTDRVQLRCSAEPGGSRRLTEERADAYSSGQALLF